MVTVRVERAFFDRKANTLRSPGQTFEATRERAEEIVGALPGYATIEEPCDADDYASMKIGELRALAKERGISVPRNANKETIAKLLRG